MKQLKKMFLMVLVTMALCCMMVVGASAADFTVDTSKEVSDTNFHTIQGAIDAADSGDTVIVAAGTYEISSTIMIEKNITLEGAGMDKTIISPTVSTMQEALKVTSAATDVTIDGLTFSGFNYVGNWGNMVSVGDSGIGEMFTGEFIMTNCKLEKFGKNGLCICGDLENTIVLIDGCYVDVGSDVDGRAPNGITIYRVPDATIQNSTILNANTTSTSSSATSIYLAQSTTATIIHNTFIDCDDYSIRADNQLDYYSTYNIFYEDGTSLYETISQKTACFANADTLLEDNTFDDVITLAKAALYAVGRVDDGIFVKASATSYIFVGDEGYYYRVANQYGTATTNTVTDEYKVAFTTLTAALDAVQAGETIYIMEDLTISEDMTIPTGVTIEVCEGVTLSFDAGLTITNNGTIANNGAIKSGSTIDGTVTGNAIETLSYEAKIGDVYYSSLSTALSEATDNVTVEVLSDATLSALTEIKISITLDLGGHTITCTSTSNAGISIYNSAANVTIKNGTVKCDTIGKTIWSYQVNNLVLEDLVVQNGFSSSTTMHISQTFSSVTILGNCQFDNMYLYGTSTIEIDENAHLVLVDYDKSSAINNSALVNNGIIESNNIFYNYQTITNNGTITSNNTWSGTGTVANNGTINSWWTFSNTVTGNPVVYYASSWATLNHFYSNYATPGTIIHVSADIILEGNSLVAENTTWIVDEGCTLTVPAGYTLTIDGSLTNSGTVANNGTIYCYGDIEGLTITGTGKLISDVNKDGEFSMLDVQEILKMSTGAVEKIDAADINGDGDINSLDAYLLYTYIAS